MFKYITQRILLMILTLFIILVMTYFLVQSVPGGPFADPTIKPAVRAVLNRRYHLDQPIWMQFLQYLKGLSHLDFGVSIKVQPQADVFKMIAARFPVTIQLNLLSNLVILPVGFILGILAALKKNSIVDHSIQIMVVVFISVPSFVLAALLQYIFAYKLGWFPITFSTARHMNLEKLLSMVLPVLALSFGGIAYIARYLRDELSEVLNSDFMLLARAKGLTMRQAVVRHALRNALFPLVGMILGIFITVLSGSIVVENVFAIPGTGRLSLAAISSNDYPLVMANVLLYTAIGLFARLILDLAYGLIDPRVTVGGGKNAE
ncbi:oligopeptide transport system permease protein OppB [Clostridia bacterium]|nr:oligopeptide transport system permease protein OppB [Clostridia bacterium]